MLGAGSWVPAAWCPSAGYYSIKNCTYSIGLTDDGTCFITVYLQSMIRVPVTQNAYSIDIRVMCSFVPAPR